MSIGKKIRLSRLSRGLTLRGLARLSRISAPALSNIELGKTTPRIATLRKIAAILGIAPGELFEEEEAHVAR